MRTQAGPTVKLAEYRPPLYLIDHVSMEFVLSPAEWHEQLGDGDVLVVARSRIRRNDGTPPGTPLVLDGDELQLADVSLRAFDGTGWDEWTEPAHDAWPDHLTIDQPPEGPFEIAVTTILRPNQNTQLSGLYRSQGVFCTQCEAEGFRRITYFLDRPDVLATYRVAIRADADKLPVALANGNLVSDGTAEDGCRVVIWDDPHPKPSYLFALVAGRLDAYEDTFTTASGRHVDLAIYVEPGKRELAGYAMDALKRSMRWDEERFGREYDLDVFNIVAVSDFNMGAMENKGLNVFNDKYVLADPASATDADYAAIEAIIAHEYFHNWTGNRITCRDWFQLCLKEGLTVYRDQEFSADMRSRTVERISQVHRLKATQFPEDAGPLAHPVRPEAYEEINNFYTATVYQKGAELVRMLETMLGRETFRAALDLYFERHDGDAATVEQFIACFEEAGDTDLSQFMRWYEQPGTPVVRAMHEAGVLTLEQSFVPLPATQENRPVPIPVRWGAVGGDEDGLVVVDAEKVSVETGLADDAKLSLLRDFSAPVNLEFAESEEDLAMRARLDGNLFNRWDAMQRLSRRIMLSAWHDGADEAHGAAWADAVAATVTADDLEPSFRGHCLVLPSENELALAIGKDVDPDRVRELRRSLRGDLAARLESDALGIMDALAVSHDYRPDYEDAGRRTLRNGLLHLMCSHDDEAMLENARTQFETADNMTDRLGALTALVSRDDEGAEAALEAFHAAHADNPLVIDKWLALQAMMPGDGALARVGRLMRHSSFKMENPNRVRSLVGAFAAGNPSGFHRADGGGYEWLADRIIELDGRNRQVAARLATSLRTYGIYDAPRRGRAEAALARIAGTKGLSRDVAEIIGKIRS